MLEEMNYVLNNRVNESDSEGSLNMTNYYNNYEDDWASDEDDYYTNNHNHRSKNDATSFTEIKEQMYQDKLAELKRQLNQLHNGTLPEYLKHLKRLGHLHNERIRFSETVRDLEIELVEQEYINEKKASVSEFEDQKIYLKEQLTSDLEDKLKIIENERHSMELTGDSMELKTISTRKLRRRANEPSSGGYGGSEKRRKTLQVGSLSYVLDETDIIDDLKIINKNKAFSYNRSRGSNSNSTNSLSLNSHYYNDIRVEEGKLFYQKRWFRRGQPVLVESKNGEKYSAMISAIGSDVISVKKPHDNNKIKILIAHLQKGKITLKRRAS